MFGGSTGTADPSVLVLDGGVTLPASESTRVSSASARLSLAAKLQLLGDYLEVGEQRKSHGDAQLHGVYRFARPGQMRSVQ